MAKKVHVRGHGVHHHHASTDKKAEHATFREGGKTEKVVDRDKGEATEHMSRHGGDANDRREMGDRAPGGQTSSHHEGAGDSWEVGKHDALPGPKHGAYKDDVGM